MCYFSYIIFYINRNRRFNNGLFSISGIRIYHIDSRITKNDAENIIDIFDYDNSYTDHRLISLVQASGSNAIDKGSFSSNSDLLKCDTEYVINKWYSKTNLEFVISATLKQDLSVDINITRR